MIVLSLIAIVYIGFVAIVQQDMKKLIAYSSISHMGFVTLGCFMIYAIFQHTSVINNAGLGMEGAIVVMISHGFVSGASVDRKGSESYQLLLGGSGDEDTSQAKIAGPGFDEDGIVDAIERAVEQYRTVRAPGERFIDTYRRVGMDGFKEAIYG
jgi:hypothetical protein